LHPDAGGDHMEFISMSQEYRYALNQIKFSSESREERGKANELLGKILKLVLDDPNIIFRLASLVSNRNELQKILDEFMNGIMSDTKSRGIEVISKFIKHD
jgi:hypothetical protein